MKIMLISVFFWSCCIPLFSQTRTTTQKLIDTTSTKLCMCFNHAFDSLDSEVKGLIKEVLINPDSGQQKIQDYIKSVGKERSDEVIQQLQKMGSIDSDLTTCFNNATSIFQHLPCGLEDLSVDDQLIVMKDFESEEKTIDLLMQNLATKEGCEFAYQFMKLGLELEKK